jgi:hypothetical protein
MCLLVRIPAAGDYAANAGKRSCGVQADQEAEDNMALNVRRESYAYEQSRKVVMLTL